MTEKNEEELETKKRIILDQQTKIALKTQIDAILIEMQQKRKKLSALKQEVAQW